MEAKDIEELLKRRYPQARFKVEFLPFGDISKVLIIQTDLYDERGEEVEREIRRLLREYGVEVSFYRDLRTGAISAGEFAFILIGPFREG